MKTIITSTDAARNLGECLSRIKYTGDSYILTKNHKPVAELVPVSGGREATLSELIASMRALTVDEEFADDLEKVNSSDREMENPWPSF